MKALLVFVICISLIASGVFTIGLLSCDEPPIQTSEAGQTTKPNKNDCSAPRTLIKVGLNESWIFVHDHHEEVIAVGTVFIAIFTIVLGLFTVSLAGATKKLVSGAESAERRQLRAYVGLDKISFECDSLHISHYEPTDLSTPGKIHRDFIVIKVRNYGMTPAYGVTVYAYFVATNFPDRLPDGFFTGQHDRDIVSWLPVRPTLARFILHKDQMELSKHALPDITELRNAVRKQKQIYVFGRVYYRDAFRRPWRTKFCYSWEPWHPNGERFVAYEKYNDEDQIELSEFSPDTDQVIPIAG